MSTNRLSYRGYRYPPQVISQVGWQYQCFCPRFRNVEGVMALHAVAGNLFPLGRHLLRAVHYREFRLRAFSTWRQVTCA